MKEKEEVLSYKPWSVLSFLKAAIYAGSEVHDKNTVLLSYLQSIC